MSDETSDTTPSADPEQPSAQPEPVRDEAAGDGTASDSQKQAHGSLEELLSGLDEDARRTVLRQVRKARTEAANLRTRLQQAEPKIAEYDKLIEAQKSSEQKAVERAETAEQALRAVNERLAAAEVRSLAARDFADPDDAAAFLDLSGFLAEDGKPDREAITAALGELLTSKPHLARSASPRRPAPDPTQASSAQPSTPSPEDVFAGFLQAQLQRS